MTRALALVLVVLLLVWQSGISTPTRVSIVRPLRLVQEYQSVRWMIQIAPDKENRLLVFAALDESGPVRQSREQLEGESAARTRWIVWNSGLPAGEYLLVAAVFSSTKEVARANVPVTVLARF